MVLITKDLNSGLTKEQLAQFIIGDAGTVVPGSVNFTGDNRAAGTFGGGISEEINVEAGVIFSTGDIASANGPNNNDSTGTTFNTAGDADLNVLIAATGFTTNDAAVLEFDFIPKQNQFALEYVFASEEYNQYIGQYNDVFGFFVNGVNTPLVPGTNQPVSIDTINGTKNKAFFFNNDFSELGPLTPYQTTFNGFTAVLTAQGAVIPNVPNRLKLAIADTKDFTLNSAVFISALPLFNFSQPTYQVNEDGTVVGATITINRSGISNATSKVDVNFTNGSATGGATLGLGVDFVFTTQTVSFAADQTTATISVPINNDSLVEPTENLTLTLANPQNGIIGITQNTANLDILTDNDTAGIIITSTGGADVAEGGTSDTYTVVLQSQPSDLVIVTVDPDNQTNLGAGTGVPLTLNFTPNNWNVPQTVTIEAVDAQIAEASPHTSAIAHTASSVDPNYDGAAVPITIDGTVTATLTANITDNDTPSVKITETGDTTKIGEGGNSDSYTAVLTTQPAADVTVTASPDAQSDVGIGGGIPIALKFTPDNWNVPQLVNVQAVDDAVAQGTHSSTIAHQVTSTDAKYNLIATASVTAQITDNDTAGVTITPASTTATEGGVTGSYKVALTSKPTAPVNVNFNTGIQIDSISTFTFTSDNWNLPQTVTVKATDDSLVEGLHTGTIDHSIAVGSAAEYLPVTIAPVTVSITDNDVATPNTPSITITPASTTAAEGGATDSYTVSLNTQPTANVTVNVAAGSQIEAIAPIVFTPANWNVPQTVTVTATDDTVVEGSHSGTINHNVAAGSAAEYLPVAIAPVTVTIADNDTATST
ncbi:MULTISPECIES: choice-of-anchor L domain-containing protein, partial [unclassified Microcoleus]|uniref:choice-of-anchor L domain-containing protein n=1 Tax=unclassified Microcoleus TaxID=2642155 RepID=UPI002FD389CC